MISRYSIARAAVVLVVTVLAPALFGLPRYAYAQGATITLQDAVRQQIVKVQLTGSGEPFWQESVAYTIENTKAAPITILVPVGFILEPEDDSYQQLVIAREYVIPLCGAAPATPKSGATPCAGSSVQGKWYAFCINLSRHAPDEDTEYRPGQMAAGPLLQVVQAVNRKSAAGRLGAQFAVWRVTDNFSLDSLNSPDLQNSELIQLVAPLLSLARPEIDLAQSVLQDSGTGLKFYTGTPPPDLFNPGTLLSPGERTGIPEVDAMKKQVEDSIRGLAIVSGLAGGICVLSCVGLVGLVAFFALKRK